MVPLPDRCVRRAFLLGEGFLDQLVHEMPEGTISRRANREDKCRGAFFEARFKSVAILDDEALLATSTYIDLNPVAAKLAEVPESSEHTSIKRRVEHIKTQDATTELEAAQSDSVAGSRAASGLEEALWLCPIEDRRQLDSSREGMFEGLSIGNYLLWSTIPGGSFARERPGFSADLAGILDRLGSSAEGWRFRMERLKNGRSFGRFFAASRDKLRELAKRKSVRHLVNLVGYAAPS